MVYDVAPGEKSFSLGTRGMLERLSDWFMLCDPNQVVTVHYVGKTIQEGRKRFRQKYPNSLDELSASLGV
jgi:hypothetical protein